jgi:hypothetical protein
MSGIVTSVGPVEVGATQADRDFATGHHFKF